MGGFWFLLDIPESVLSKVCASTYNRCHQTQINSSEFINWILISGIDTAGIKYDSKDS